MRTKGISVLVVCTAALSFSLSLSLDVDADWSARRPITVGLTPSTRSRRPSSTGSPRWNSTGPDWNSPRAPRSRSLEQQQQKKTEKTERGRVLERLLVPVANMKWFHLSRTFRTMLKKTISAKNGSTFLWLNRGANKKILGRQHVGSDDAGRAASRRPFPAPRNTNGD